MSHGFRCASVNLSVGVTGAHRLDGILSFLCVYTCVTLWVCVCVWESTFIPRHNGETKKKNRNVPRDAHKDKNTLMGQSVGSYEAGAIIKSLLFSIPPLFCFVFVHFILKSPPDSAQCLWLWCQSAKQGLSYLFIPTAPPDKRKIIIKSVFLFFLSCSEEKHKISVLEKISIDFVQKQ